MKYRISFNDLNFFDVFFKGNLVRSLFRDYTLNYYIYISMIILKNEEQNEEDISQK